MFKSFGKAFGTTFGILCGIQAFQICRNKVIAYNKEQEALELAEKMSQNKTTQADEASN